MQRKITTNSTSLSWLIAELLVASFMCLLPIIWTQSINQYSLNKGLVLAAITILSSELLRQFVGKEKLKNTLLNLSNLIQSGSNVSLKKFRRRLDLLENRFDEIEWLLANTENELNKIDPIRLIKRTENLSHILNSFENVLKENMHPERMKFLDKKLNSIVNDMNELAVSIDKLREKLKIIEKLLKH